MQRSLAVLSPSVYNMFKYTPWYFFTGRKNFAHGRDKVYSLNNTPLALDNGQLVSDYTNALSLRDGYTLNNVMDFKPLTLSNTAMLNQISSRENTGGVPGQAVTANFGTTISIDLTKIFSFTLPAPKRRVVQPVKSLNLDLGYTVASNMLVTQNILEYSHTPGIGLFFGWNDKSIRTSFDFDYRVRKMHEYIPNDYSKRDRADDIYYNALSTTRLRTKDYGYGFKAEYKMGLFWLYDIFSQYYLLFSYPVWSFSYTLKLNRYDYTYSVSPEPYDMHLLQTELILDIHQYVKGGLTAKCVLERYHNPETGGVNREILSYEIGFNVSLVY